MNFRRIGTLAFHFLLIGYLHGQDLKKGYVVLVDGDTLSGFIEDRIDDELANSVNFKINLDSDVTNYTPTELLNFKFVSGRTFFSQLNSNGESVFAKRIATGKIDVLVARDVKPKNFEIYLHRSDTDMNVVLQSGEKSEVYENGDAYNKTSLKYLGLLSYITDGYSRDKTRFKEDKIADLIEDYNKSNSSSYPSSRYKEPNIKSYEFHVGFLPSKGLDISNATRFNLYRNIKNTDHSKLNYRRTGVSYWRRSFFGDGVSHWVNITFFGFKHNFLESRLTPYVQGGIGLLFIFEPKRNSGFGAVPIINASGGLHYSLNKKYDLILDIVPFIADIYPLKIKPVFNFGISSAF